MISTILKEKKRIVIDFNKSFSQIKKPKSTLTISKTTIGNTVAKQATERKKKTKALTAKNPSNIFIIESSNNA
jgi:hypothetical protein